MNRKETLAIKIADIFDLPPDLITDSFRLTLVGPGQLFLENHQGIILYEETDIRVKVKNGEIMIKGEQLKLRSVLTKELFIVGYISSIAVDTQR